MVPLLLFVLALQEDPFPGLVRQLDHDVAEVREKATAELFRLGEARRADLEKALNAATDPEVASRLRSVLGKLDAEKRRREFKGGPVVEDLGILLTCTYNKKTMELIVSVEVSNLGPVPRTMVDIEDWNTRLPRQSRSSSSAEGQIEVRQLTGQRPEGSFRSTLSCGTAPARRTLTLKPGEQRIFSPVVDASSLPPGRHQVKAKVFAPQLLGLAEDLVSNAQSFEVPQ